MFRDRQPAGTAPDFGLPVRVRAQQTAAALIAVPTHAGPVARTAALRQAAAVTDELVAALSAQDAAVVGEDLPAGSTGESFFRVREVYLSDHQAALRGASIVQRGSEARWTARWIVGHQVHVLFNTRAAAAVTDAAHHLRHGAVQAALRWLGHATTFVRGFPAATTHASTIPVEYYTAAVRPAMQPPEVAGR